MSITRINNNVAAINAGRNLESTGRSLQKSIERLSTGLRINRAADDAAGLTIATRIRSQVKGLDRAIMNAQDGINLVNVAEGAMEEMIQRLDRIRVLSIQAANTGVNDLQARQALQDEIFQSIDEITRIANTTQYSNNLILNGDYSVDTKIVPGQDGTKHYGVKINSDPSASTLNNGTHFLNILRTKQGYASFVPGFNENGDNRTMHIGVENATDIAVSLARFSTIATGGGAGLLSQSVTNTDNLFASGAATTYFNGVSIYRTDVLVIEGVLADGVTKFAGALSLAGGAAYTFGQATSASTTLLGSINQAIDRAEMALFGVNSSASVPTAYRTTVTLADSASGSANEGRLLLVSDGSFINQSSISISLIRNGKLVTQAGGVTRSGVIGTKSGLSGVGQVGNNITAITGSTFGTGQFNISIEDVIAPQNRIVQNTVQFLNSAGAIISRSTSLTRTSGGSLKMNGTFVNGTYTNGVSISAGDTITMRGIEADGTTFQAVYTFSNSSATDIELNDFQFSSLSGLISELNYRTRYYATGTATNGYQTRFESALFTLTPDGKLQLIDDLARSNSKIDFSITFNDSSSAATPNYTIQDKAVLVAEGFAETATIRINDGPAVRAEAGQVITAYGPEATRQGQVREQLTFRIGSNLTAGTDFIYNEAQQFVGRLNGGPAVTFQNGQQSVAFIDDSTLAREVARFVTIDFDSIVNITAAQNNQPDAGTTLVISVVNRSMNFHIGAFANQSFQTAIGDLRSSNLGFGRGTGRTVENIDVRTLSGANEAIRIVDKALDQINRTRSLLGAATNRLEGTVANLSVSSENLLASESRLRDADFAKETATFTRNQILMQAGTSVLAQANFLPQGLLSLLG